MSLLIGRRGSRMRRRCRSTRGVRWRCYFRPSGGRGRRRWRRYGRFRCWWIDRHWRLLDRCGRRRRRNRSRCVFLHGSRRRHRCCRTLVGRRRRRRSDPFSGRGWRWSRRLRWRMRRGRCAQGPRRRRGWLMRGWCHGGSRRRSRRGRRVRRRCPRRRRRCGFSYGWVRRRCRWPGRGGGRRRASRWCGFRRRTLLQVAVLILGLSHDERRALSMRCGGRELRHRQGGGGKKQDAKVCHDVLGSRE